MADVEVVIQEMFQAPHIQVCWNLQCVPIVDGNFG
jgi:hypothetical protein